MRTFGVDAFWVPVPELVPPPPWTEDPGCAAAGEELAGPGAVAVAVAVAVAMEAVAVRPAPGSGANGLCELPVRCSDAPLVVSATAWSALAGAWLTGMPAEPGWTGSGESEGELEPPPSSAYASAATNATTSAARIGRRRLSSRSTLMAFKNSLMASPSRRPVRPASFHSPASRRASRPRPGRTRSLHLSGLALRRAHTRWR